MDKLKESELFDAAEEYVFDQNGHKFSNNNDEAGDNFGSFVAGANWMLNKIMENKNSKELLFYDRLVGGESFEDNQGNRADPLDIAKSVMAEDRECLKKLGENNE
jgi:hypothetical protein